MLSNSEGMQRTTNGTFFVGMKSVRPGAVPEKFIGGN